MEDKELSLEMEKKILKAATSVFIHKGKAGASMQDIAVEAGINRPLLNYYFRSKDKLFEEVFSEVLLEFIPGILKKLNSDKPVIIRIEDVIDFYFHILIENPHIPVFILQELSANPQRLVRNIREKGLDPSFFLTVLSGEMEQGNLRRMDPRTLIVNLLSLVIFPFAAAPLIEGLLFKGSRKDYQHFLEERRSDLKKNFIESIKP